MDYATDAKTPTPDQRRPLTRKNMKDELPSLITSDRQAGLALAGQLADSLQAELAKGDAQVERPGGMNYLLPAHVPKAIIASVLFYAIAAANKGWAGKA